jgi:Putative phage metallopeptidase
MANARKVKDVPRHPDAMPLPPADLGQYREPGGWVHIVPATGLRDWILKTFIEEGAKLFNEEHRHLREARFECLWASGSFDKQGRTVIGLTEEVSFRVSGWPRWRQEQQLQGWFGLPLPDYLITLDASYCSTAGEAEVCALVEHELYHIGQKRNAFGEFEFTQDGAPKLFIRGHDVEEFVGVVRRYGVGHPGGKLAQLVEAGRSNPTVSRLHLAQACGTCLLKSA